MGLAFFKRVSDGVSINLVSYHNPRSITWSWLVCWRPYVSDERRRWLGWHSWPGRYGWFEIALLKRGRLHFAWQPKMIRRAAP